jgi:hypothetical protein
MFSFELQIITTLKPVRILYEVRSAIKFLFSNIIRSYTDTGRQKDKKILVFDLVNVNNLDKILSYKIQWFEFIIIILNICGFIHSGFFFLQKYSMDNASWLFVFRYFCIL